MWFRPLLIVALFARLAAAQATGSTVSGVVRDSITRAPLAGAVVQLVAADGRGHSNRSAVTDSLGRFLLRDVLDGRYALGFLHPMLDSLGIEPILREVFVTGTQAVRADLAIPSPARMRAGICGPTSAADRGVVVGVIRDAADRAPASGVAVIGAWTELSFTSTGLSRRFPRLVATTGPNGWFAICNVPSAGTMALMANRGADSTDVIEVEVPAEGFLRRDLYLGPAHIGNGRLSGTVVGSAGGRPLAGAQVSIPGGPQTRANERGEWTLGSAPSGTRMLEVRAVGYYPDRRAVDVVGGAPTIRSSLSTMKAVLDTVRVTASRQAVDNMRGFEERRRGSIGKYLTSEDVTRHAPIVTSEVFTRVAGLSVERAMLGDRQLTMRGTFEERCFPAIYIDGQMMSDLTADEIDTYVHPDEVAGIEIYIGPGTPPQFSTGMGIIGTPREGPPLISDTLSAQSRLQACGSVVIWTKRKPRMTHPASWTNRVLYIGGLAAAAMLVALMLDRR